MQTRMINGVHLIEEGDMVIRAFEERGAFEPDSFAVWREYAQPGTVAIDVGAYTGLYAIAAAKQGAMAIAFEPHPITFKRLKENCDINFAHVKKYNAAAWDEDTPLLMNTKSDVAMSSASNFNGEGDREILVAAMEMDKLKLKDVSIIKVDAEGTEERVLAGALHLLVEYRPVVLTEQLNKESGKAVACILTPLGYTARPLSQNMVVWERHVR